MRHRPAGRGAAWRCRSRRALLLAPVALFLAAFFAGPIAAVLRVSLAANPGGTGYGDGVPFYVPGTWTLANYARFFADAHFLGVTALTVKLGLLTAVVTTVVSYCLAWQIHRARPIAKAALLLVVVLPKFTNVLVLMYGFLLVFGASGLVNRALLAVGLITAPLPMVYNLFAVVLAEVVLVLPYCVLVLVAALHAIDRDLEEAARSLGASDAQVFWHVVLPLSMPGVWVSALLSFIWGIGASWRRISSARRSSTRSPSRSIGRRTGGSTGPWRARSRW
jgi:putative spermidine/putrescine transport system permease protein